MPEVVTTMFNAMTPRESQQVVRAMNRVREALLPLLK